MMRLQQNRVHSQSRQFATSFIYVDAFDRCQLTQPLCTTSFFVLLRRSVGICVSDFLSCDLSAHEPINNIPVSEEKVSEEKEKYTS